MSFRCALFGHKFGDRVDKFSVTTKSGAKLEIQSCTCTRCKKKTVKVLGDCKVELDKKGNTLDFSVEFQPDIKGSWNVTH